MPKVSFYLRNEDVEAWKAIDKKTAWVHDQLADTPPLTVEKAKDLLGGSATIRMANELKQYSQPAFPKHANRSADLKPKPNMFDRTIDTCKHGVDKKFCVKGCK